MKTNAKGNLIPVRFGKGVAWVCMAFFTLGVAAGPASPYGVHAHIYWRDGDDPERSAAVAAAIGIGRIRATFDWDGIECPEGSWNFARSDMAFAAAEKHGLKILPVLGFGTKWARPAYLHLDRWDEYVRRFVGRYGKRISEIEVWNEENCDSYFWDPMGHEYSPGSNYVPGNAFDPEDHVFNMSTHGNPYVRTYTNIYGCDSVVSMNVTFEYTPHPTPIYPMDATNDKPHWVVTATEFQINSYDFNLWDENPNCHWDTVLWTCDEAPDWILEPFGDRGQCCKLYVLGYIEDTIWLKAHAFNRCAPDEGIEQKYWLISSFYGIEEQAASLSSFDVVPNPNNGQMTLNFEYLTGKVNIRVYDMRGTLIDQFETYNGNGPGTYQYNMRTKADGIYFFVATSKEGTVAKKVVIQH